MSTVKHILIPTDFSENAEIALRYAISNFNGPEVIFSLIHVYHLPYSGAVISIDLDDLLKQERIKLMKQTLTDAREQFPQAMIKANTMQGLLVDGIAKLSESETIDMIVMGTKGASGIKEILIGSNAVNVMRHAKPPVILVPKETKVHVIRNIVFATDLRYINGFSSIKPLRNIVKSTGSKLEILHLQSDSDDPTEMNREELRLSTVFSDVPHRFHFEEMTQPEDDILDFAHKMGADLIAVVSRHYGFFYRMLHRSVSRKLSMHTDIPVLVLKEKS